MSVDLVAGRPGSATTWPAGAPPAPEERLGAITIADRVVEKLASFAAWEVPDAGSAATRVLGQKLPGAGYLGLPDSRLDSAPKASVRVDGHAAYVTLLISVRWPCSVPHVADDVRERVRERVGALTGLIVRAVRIEVTDLVPATGDGRRRVR